jgi:hypothetical protein
MASWTDTPVNFTPYIAEQPVDAMVTVGMSKQRDYLDGLQKVQTYVDSIGGLDVSKQEIKNYVQGKMNLLHQNLNNISGDFSDRKLVGQIGGAANKIANDPIVQNGLIATNLIKKGYQDIETARRAGKSNPNNELYFTDAVAAWQNDGQVDTKLNASYSEYYDIVGEVRKVFKDMTGGQELPSGFGSQNIKRDPATGKVVFDLNYTGNQVLMEGIGVDRVQHAIDLVMQNGNAQRQLTIDGYAKYRGVDGAGMFEAITTSTQAQLAKINDAIIAAQSKLGGSTVGDKSAIIRDIQQLKRASEALVSRSESMIRGLDNPEAVKAKLIEEELRSDLVGTLAYQKMVESPLWNANLELEKYNLLEEKFKFEQIDANRKFELDKFKAETDRLKADKEEKEKAGQNYVADLPVANTAGQAGQASMYQIKDEALSKAETISYEAMSEYANAAQQPPPYKLDPITNRWIPNADAYGGGEIGTEAAKKAGIKLVADAKSRRTKGILTPEESIAMQKEESAWDEYNLVDNKILEIEKSVAPQIKELKESVGTRSDGSKYPADWFDAYSVDKDLPGSDAAEQRLIKKHGNSWRSKLGINLPLSTGRGGGATDQPNYGEYVAFRNKLSKNPNAVNLSQEIENRFKGSQFAYQNKATVFDRNTDKLKEDVKTAFTAALTEQSLVSPQGDAGDIKEWMNDKPEKQAGDQYMAWSEYQDGKQTWWLGIQRGDDFKKVQVKQSTFQQNRKLQQAVPNVEFQNMFGSRLALRGGVDTFTDDRDLSLNAGQASAYTVPVKSGTITYNDNGTMVTGTPTVQYHLQEPATARGQYRLKLYITDAKTGKTLVQGAPYPPSDFAVPGQTPTFTQEQIIDQVKNRLSNPDFIQGYLDKYYNK